MVLPVSKLLEQPLSSGLQARHIYVLYAQEKLRHAAAGVLKHKKAAEDMIQQKGIPYTIFRLGRLTDGPYTSFDLNTLLQATAGSRQDVKLSLEDDQTAEASRIAAAEACLQSLRLDSTNNMIYSLTSQEGEGPGQSLDAWRAVFAEFI